MKFNLFCCFFTPKLDVKEIKVLPKPSPAPLTAKEKLINDFLAEYKEGYKEETPADDVATMAEFNRENAPGLTLSK